MSEVVAEPWVVGYVIEFSDGGPLERVIVRECDELCAERTARALEKIGALPYEGERPVVQGIVFTAARSSLADDTSDSAASNEGPKPEVLGGGVLVTDDAEPHDPYGEERE